MGICHSKLGYQWDNATLSNSKNNKGFFADGILMSRVGYQNTTLDHKQFFKVADKRSYSSSSNRRWSNRVKVPGSYQGKLPQPRLLCLGIFPQLSSKCLCFGSYLRSYFSCEDFPIHIKTKTKTVYSFLLFVLANLGNSRRPWEVKEGTAASPTNVDPVVISSIKSRLRPFQKFGFLC